MIGPLFFVLAFLLYLLLKPSIRKNHFGKSRYKYFLKAQLKNEGFLLQKIYVPTDVDWLEGPFFKPSIFPYSEGFFSTLKAIFKREYYFIVEFSANEQIHLAWVRVAEHPLKGARATWSPSLPNLKDDFMKNESWLINHYQAYFACVARLCTTRENERLRSAPIVQRASRASQNQANPSGPCRLHLPVSNEFFRTNAVRVQRGQVPRWDKKVPRGASR